VAGTVRITLLVENTASDKKLRGEHGFAAWVETDAGRILFDTGQGGALIPNAARLGVDLATADAVALSHGHYDHTGGLAAALAAAPSCPVYAHPDVTAPKYAFDGAASHGAARSIGMPAEAERLLAPETGKLVETQAPTAVLPGVHVTGEVPRLTEFEDAGGPFFLDEECTVPDAILDDQALFFMSERGIVLVLGCAHAGMINTMRYVASLTGRRTFACVLGGTHLIAASDERIARTIEALADFDVERIGPCHCTGERAVAWFRDEFRDRLLPCAAGWSMDFRI
jgi:7,8-dihydropterin-6-yl-methyl-4-(beta-D-ribofuranosyl)aminobenzene 5'-phosphate synthase